MDWDTFIRDYPDAHILQNLQWGKLKEQFGWRMDHLIQGEWGAQILIRSILPAMKMAYIAKGPLGPESSIKSWLQGDVKHGGDFIHLLDEFCLVHKIFFVKIEPDEEECGEIPAGFIRSAYAIQPLRTILVNIKDADDKILQRMKQKTRYNIRLAERKGVKVETSDDIETFYLLAKQTSQRDQFGIHSLGYYQTAYQLFHDRGQCELFLARYAGKAISGIMVFANGNRAWYFYGASSNEHREVMAPYLLQWEAIQWAKRKGCSIYDLWGIPDYHEAYLEDNFMQNEKGLWGVYRFKRGFGGFVFRSAGAFDRVYNPRFYQFYNMLLKVRRFRG